MIDEAKGQDDGGLDSAKRAADASMGSSAEQTPPQTANEPGLPVATPSAAPGPDTPLPVDPQPSERSAGSRENPLLAADGTGRFVVIQDLHVKPVDEMQRHAEDPQQAEPAAATSGGDTSRTTATEGAAFADPVAAKAMIAELIAGVDYRADLWRNMPQEERATQREAFEKVLKDVGGAVDWYGACEDHDEAARKQLVDAYFRLDRLIQGEEQRESSSSELTERAPARTPKKTEAVKPLSQRSAEDRRRIRLTAIIVIALSVVAWRSWTLIRGPELNTELNPVEHVAAGNAVVGIDVEGQSAAVTTDVQHGVPIVASVRLLAEDDGSLRARANAIDDGSSPPNLVFKWHSGDTLITEEHDGILRAADVERGRAYTVTVIASDGTNTSRPVKTKPFVAPGPVKGGS